MDQLDAHHRAITAVQSVLDQVTPDQLSVATPCAEWDVKALITHMVGGNWWVASMLGATPPEGDPLGDDPSAAFAASADAAQAAFQQEGALERSYDLPFGTVPGFAWIGLRTTDLLVHAWDLAKATGQRTDLDPELAAEALDASRMRIQPGFRGPGRPFQAEQEAPDDAPAADRLAAFLGRTL